MNFFWGWLAGLLLFSSGLGTCVLSGGASTKPMPKSRDRLEVNLSSQETLIFEVIPSNGTVEDSRVYLRAGGEDFYLGIVEPYRWMWKEELKTEAWTWTGRDSMGSRVWWFEDLEIFLVISGNLPPLFVHADSSDPPLPEDFWTDLVNRWTAAGQGPGTRRLEAMAFQALRLEDQDMAQKIWKVREPQVFFNPSGRMKRLFWLSQGGR